MLRCCSAVSTDSRCAISALLISSSRRMSLARIDFSISIFAALAAISDSALLAAICASCVARSDSSVFTCSICASCSSRSICSVRFAASMAERRTDTSASASIVARSFFEVAITSASLRMPTALKALFSSSAVKGVWSRAVSETDSSSRPLRRISSVSEALTSLTNAPRPSWS